MDMKPFFEQMAKQIAQIFWPDSDINTPVVTMLFWTSSAPRVTRPSPSKFWPPGGVPISKPPLLAEKETLLIRCAEVSRAHTLNGIDSPLPRA